MIMINLFKKKNGGYIIISLIICFVVFLNLSCAKASIVTELLGRTTNVASWGLYLIMGAVIQGIAWFIGQVITVLTSILLSVAQYSDFINNSVVDVGWPIVRDVCNMFFILVLLIIAFATILRVESYNYKKNLPKLLIMAVLINFSKTICGLAIDFVQVIMLTFVNGFSATGAGNLFDAFGIGKIFEISNIPNLVVDKTVSGLSVFGSLLLGLIILIIAGIIIGVFTIILAFRIVMFWILIILSPLAFLAMAIPSGSKYASQWVGQFTKNLIVGPVLAFFLWLSLATVGQVDYANFDGYKNSVDNASEMTVSAALTTAGSKDNLTKFIVSCCMLIGGLMMAQQMGGAAGSIAGKGMSWIKSAASMPVGAGKLGLKGLKEAGSWGLDKVSLATGGAVDFNLGRTWGRMKDQFAKNKSTRAGDIEAQVAGKAQEGGRLAMLTHGGLALQNLNSWKKIKWALGMKQPDLEFGKQATKLEKEREKIMSQSEYDEKLKEKEETYIQYGSAITDKKREIKEESDPEKNKKLKQEEQQLNKEQDEFNNNDLKQFRDKRNLTVASDESVKEMDEEIKYNREQYEKYKFQGDDVAESSKAEMVSAQEKKIAQIDNADKLGNMFKSALKEGNQGLITAIARKMTKLGDYNELCQIMKVGTGTKGMQALAKKFQNSGMSEQSSRGLIAEMGGICKNLGQFGGFYAMKMDKGGNWQETEEDEAQAAQLAVMKKMQPQAFSRTVGRLGLGYYDDPSGQGKQDKSTYRLSKATIAHLSSSQKNLGEEYNKTGMAEALEYLSAGVGQFAKNDILDTNLMKAIKRYKGDKDMEARIRSVKT